MMTETEFTARFGHLGMSYADRVRDLLAKYPDARALCCELSADWVSSDDLRAKLAGDATHYGYAVNVERA